MERYRVETTRLPGRDYGEIGAYIVTICTENRRHWFGEVRNERMVLNSVGMIVAEEILKTLMLRKNVAIDTWIVMPNHVHVIVEILPPRETSTVETHCQCVSSDVTQLIPLFRRKQGSLGAIIACIKSDATKRIWAAGHHDFRWQPRFHDSILRTDRSIENARSYVMMNPIRWWEKRGETH